MSKNLPLEQTVELHSSSAKFGACDSDKNLESTDFDGVCDSALGLINSQKLIYVQLRAQFLKHNGLAQNAPPWEFCSSHLCWVLCVLCQPFVLSGYSNLIEYYLIYRNYSAQVAGSKPTHKSEQVGKEFPGYHVLLMEILASNIV